MSLEFITKYIDEAFAEKASVNIISVVGPTCTGKTSLSLELAKHSNAEIVNADSRLIFEEMNIGTAKPSEQELSSVKHHLVNIRKPDQIYSSGEYQKDFDQIAKDIKKPLVLVGGTGMYLRTALEDLDMPDFDSDPEIRDELENKSLEDLHAELKHLDPDAFDHVDYHNRRRVIRAIEILRLAGSGSAIKDLRGRSGKDRYSAIWVGLNFKDRAKLYDLIDKRVLDMMDQGLLAEVEALLNKYGTTTTILKTIGYAETCEHLQGNLSLDEAIALIQKKTRNYAKRQMTWFRSNPRIKWFECEDVFGL